jgi:hypothetical protein
VTTAVHTTTSTVVESSRQKSAKEGDPGSTGTGFGDGNDGATHVRTDERDAFAVGGMQRLVVAIVIAGIDEVDGQSSIA